MVYAPGIPLYLNSMGCRKVNANLSITLNFSITNFLLEGFGKNGVSHTYSLGNMHPFAMLHDQREVYLQDHMSTQARFGLKSASLFHVTNIYNAHLK